MPTDVEVDAILADHDGLPGGYCAKCVVSHPCDAFVMADGLRRAYDVIDNLIEMIPEGRSNED